MRSARLQHRKSKLALVFIVIGLVILFKNFAPDIMHSTETSTVIDRFGDRAGELGDVVGDAGERLGDAASEFGSGIGDVFSDLGDEIGKVFDGNESRSVFRWDRLWPLLLIVVGLSLILRRPRAEQGKVKNDEEW